MRKITVGLLFVCVMTAATSGPAHARRSETFKVSLAQAGLGFGQPTWHGYTISYLLARRSLNPTRFDHYHPGFIPWLAQQDRLNGAMGQTCIPVNGLLPVTPYYNYLRWRRSLNPARFDHYHPNLGPALALDAALRAHMAVCLNPVPEVPTPPGLGGGGGVSGGGSNTPPSFMPPGLPPGGSNNVNPPGQGVGTEGTGGSPGALPPSPMISPPIIPTGPAPVPEPSSLMLLLIGSAAVAFPTLARRWRNRLPATA